MASISTSSTRRSSKRRISAYFLCYIVGQTRAKKALSVAVYNHYVRLQHFPEDVVQDLQAVTLMPSRRINPQHVTSDQLNHHGRSGRSYSESHYRTSLSVHSSSLDQHTPRPEKSNVLVIGPTGTGKTMLARTLARILDVPFAASDATALTQAGYVGEDVDMCLQRLLQASDWDVNRASFGIVYIDEVDKLAKRSVGSRAAEGPRDVGGEGVQQALLRMMEGSTVTIQTKMHSPNVHEALPTAPGLNPHKRVPQELYTLDTTNILFIFSGAFVGLENIVKRRRRDAEQSIGFASTYKQGAHGTVSDSAPPWETSVRPEDLNEYGFIPEFISRLPVLATLSPLNVKDLLRILTGVKDSLISQYVTLFEYSGIELRFTRAALLEIAQTAMSRGGGARGLRSIVENTLLDSMFEGPGSSIRYILISRDVVRGLQPAHYWSRGEGAAFWTAFKDEEEQFI